MAVANVPDASTDISARGGRRPNRIDASIIACVIYWQAKEISRVVRWCRPKEGGETIDVTLLGHVSPIEWDNVILYGQYILDRAQVRR